MRRHGREIPLGVDVRRRRDLGGEERIERGAFSLVIEPGAHDEIEIAAKGDRPLPGEVVTRSPSSACSSVMTLWSKSLALFTKLS